MSIYIRYRAFFGKPFRLTKEQQQQPIETLHELFDKFRLEELREHLAKLLEVAFTSENDDYCDAKDRANALVFCQQIEEVIEAAYIISHHNSKK